MVLTIPCSMCKLLLSCSSGVLLSILVSGWETLSNITPLGDFFDTSLKGTTSTASGFRKTKEPQGAQIPISFGHVLSVASLI